MGRLALRPRSALTHHFLPVLPPFACQVWGRLPHQSAPRGDTSIKNAGHREGEAPGGPTGGVTSARDGPRQPGPGPPRVAPLLCPPDQIQPFLPVPESKQGQQPQRQTEAGGLLRKTFAQNETGQFTQPNEETGACGPPPTSRVPSRPLCLLQTLCALGLSFNYSVRCTYGQHCTWQCPVDAGHTCSDPWLCCQASWLFD